VRQAPEVVEPAGLVHDLERRGMDGIAPKVPQGSTSGWRVTSGHVPIVAPRLPWRVLHGIVDVMNLLRPLDRGLVVNGLRLHLLDWGGEGRTPLLLLHGFTGSAHAWDTLSIALQPHFRVYALDQRGHGDSDPADAYNPAVAFDDIAGVVGQLALRSLVLIGLSMGGRNAMYFTAKQPALVQKLVIVDIGPEISARASAPASGPPEPETWESVEQAARHLHRSNPYPGIHYYRWVVSNTLRQRDDGALVWRWHPSIKERRTQLDLDWWALLRTITPPTLVLRGAESPVLDRDVAERMAKELPRGRFVEIPHAVHTLHEDNPEAVLGALKDFLEF
jgi:esterase